MADEAIGFSSLFAKRSLSFLSADIFSQRSPVFQPSPLSSDHSCFVHSRSTSTFSAGFVRGRGHLCGPASFVHIAELLAWTSQFEGNKPCQKCRRIKLTNYAFDVA